MIKQMSCLVVAMLALVSLASADTPANCSYEDARGLWTFHESSRGHNKYIDCTVWNRFSRQYQVQLEFPNLAFDQDGNVGFWTIIYNQGFEVVINHRKYFSFFYYKDHGDGNVTDYCGRTFVNASHETGVNPSDWSCFYGQKETTLQAASFGKNVKKEVSEPMELEAILGKKLYKKNDKFIHKINSKQKSWRAKHYDFMIEMSINDLVRMAGGKNTRNINKPKPSQRIPAELKSEIEALPDSFDWRNVNGVNYVSPVRNQGSCGSCYAFASLAMHEARLRIKTRNANSTVFSPQDIVECSPYSQGCDGGFPYLIAGKYTEDYGLVDEKCNPYKGDNEECSTDFSCRRYYGTDYKYVGGFYGACNEPLMRLSLVKGGPISVAFEVYNDFFSYSGGIYHHTFLRDSQNFGYSPFELTNHAVLVVGYGVEKTTGEKYWIVKNSWGPSWGENGFFRIRRATDECAIESIAVEADIVV